MDAAPASEELCDMWDLMVRCSEHDLRLLLKILDDPTDEASGLVGDGMPAVQSEEPMRPAESPRPIGRFRRPAPVCARRAPSMDNPAPLAGAVGFTVDDVKRLLEQHGANLLAEVRRLMPEAWKAEPSGKTQTSILMHSPDVDVEVLGRSLADQDREIKVLEERVAELQAQLDAKDGKAVEVDNALEHAVRDTRHRQVDLEIRERSLAGQQRGNAEVERTQRPQAYFDDPRVMPQAGLRTTNSAGTGLCCADVSALGGDGAGGAGMTALFVHAQGTPPWVLRKSRLWGASGRSGFSC